MTSSHVMYGRWCRCMSAGVSRRGLLVGVGVSLLLTLTLWLRCDDVTRPTVHSAQGHVIVNSIPDKKDIAVDTEYPLEDIADTDRDDDGIDQHNRPLVPAAASGSIASVGYHPIECLINGDYTLPCRQDDEGEVFLPFTFIGKYFEVYGKMAESGDQFNWQHSYSRVYAPEEKYSPDGVFMSFEHYNVEVRERVKCISAAEGVPVSTQWGPQGYFYPTQIAQYGLSHYSKYVRTGVEEVGRNIEIIDDAEHGNIDRWTTVKDGKVRNVLDSDAHSRVIEFHSSDVESEKAYVSLIFPDNEATEVNGFFLSFDVRFITNGSVTIVVETAHHHTIRIHYVCSDILLSTVGEEIFYGLGSNRTQWNVTVGRDITVDVQKGILLKYIGRKKRPPRVVLQRIRTIELRGVGRIDNVTVADEGHLMQFFYAADWLVRRQDTHGGWPISVLRSLADGRLTLAPGWYSAMAQGHAMSVLVRAYVRTGRKEYLSSAVHALALFNVAAADGGVVARFMDRHVWYEEYPTSPPSFVLNGFMYALIGLYDVAKTTTVGADRDTATRLYMAGIESLRTLLPLFDTGSGTVYDLRHFTLGGTAAPNRARWDYHATHINQLLLLASLLSDSDRSAAAELQAVAKRWTGYMKGKLAPHN